MLFDLDLHNLIIFVSFRNTEQRQLVALTNTALERSIPM